MKIFRAIAAYLSIVLLAVVNMASYLPVVAQPEDSTSYFGHDRLLGSSTDDLPYCLTEQHLSTGAGQGTGHSSFKQHLDWAAFKPIFLNTRCISGISYFLLTKFLLIGFSSTDVIFPFHQFW